MPTRRPKAYPTLSPATAAIKQPMTNIGSEKNVVWTGCPVSCFKSSWLAGDARKPAVNSRLSPGRKKPIKRPDSANRMAKMLR